MNEPFDDQTEGHVLSILTQVVEDHRSVLPMLAFAASLSDSYSHQPTSEPAGAAIFPLRGAMVLVVLTVTKGVNERWGSKCEERKRAGKINEEDERVT